MSYIDIITSTSPQNLGVDLVVGPYTIQLVHVAPSIIVDTVSTVLTSLLPNTINFTGIMPSGTYNVVAQQKDLLGNDVGSPIVYGPFSISAGSVTIELSI